MSGITDFFFLYVHYKYVNENVAPVLYKLDVHMKLGQFETKCCVLSCKSQNQCLLENDKCLS